MDQIPATKFLDIVGEVVMRIHNPEQVGKKSGKKYRVNYLVIKWTSGRQQEYVDYVKIKVMEAKKMADIRAGYIVKVPIMYSCSIHTDEVQTRNRNADGIMVTEPVLWPEFLLMKNKAIEIINSDNNYEATQQENNEFQEEVIASTETEDDLPF